MALDFFKNNKINFLIINSKVYSISLNILSFLNLNVFSNSNSKLFLIQFVYNRIKSLNRKKTFMFLFNFFINF